MNDNIHHIFSESGCPEYEVLLKYFRNQLPEEEKHRVERHLVDCPICSDVLEGLGMMKDPDKLEEIEAEIRDGIDTRKTRVIRMNFRTYAMAAAAVIVLLVGTVMIIRVLTVKQTPILTSPAFENMATTPEMKNEPSTAPMTTLAQADKKEKPKERKSTQIAEPESGSVVIENTISDGALVQSDDSTAVQEKNLLPAAEEQAAQPAAPAAAAQESTLYEMKAYSTTERSKDESNRKSAVGGVRTEMNADDMLGTAMEQYKSGSYLKASELFEKVLKEKPGNSTAIYYSASCYYYLKNYKKASKRLEKILDDRGNEYYSDAQALSEKIKAVKDSLR